jgi:hypothetical protein
MSEYARELAGWMASLEGGRPFRPDMLSIDVLKGRLMVLRHDVASLGEKGITDGPGVEAAHDLIRLLSRAVEG